MMDDGGSIVRATYHKGRRKWNAVVSLLKMIRIPYPLNCDISMEASVNPYAGNDLWWYLFSLFSMMSIWGCFVVFQPRLQNLTLFIILFAVYWLHVVAVHSVAYWHREMSPFRLIGAKAKFLIEAVPLIVEAALRHLLDFNFGYFLILLICISYFYVFAHFLHAAYDIGGKDVFLGLAMLVLVRILNQELLPGTLALSFCLGVCFYRYMMYSAPELPNHPKKELEDLPC